MSLIRQVLGKKQRVQFIQENTGTVILVDCSVQETHTRESPPTEFEVENGDTISDHIIVKPFSLEIQGIISDSPLSTQGAALTTLVSAVLPAAGVVTAGVAQALYSALSSSESPSQLAFSQLLQLQETKKPFTVLTSLMRYENMWIKSISVPRDATMGQVLNFNLSLVQLLLVSPATVNLKIFKDANLAAELANLGKQDMADTRLAEKFKAGRVFGLESVGGL